MYKSNKLTYTNLLKGGNVARDGYDKVRSSKLLSTIAIIIIIILVIYIVYKIWNYFYNTQEQEETECIPSRGCILFSGVKNGTDIVTIKANRMPPSIHGNDYSLCVWLYVRSSNFSPSERKWKTIMYRGASETSPSLGNGAGTDAQYSVQPGVWLNGQTNKLLIRWETLGRVSDVSPCCNPNSCKTAADLGKRCMMGESERIKFCDRDKNGQIGWQDYAQNQSSMNPYVNPPNKQCSAVSVSDKLLYNTNNANTDNEICVDNIPLDRWFHLAMITHTQSSDVYIDGKLVTTLAFNSSPVVNNDAPLVLCKDCSNTMAVMGRNGFLGALTQVRYFKMALSPYDVLKIYSWGPHPFEVPDPSKLAQELEASVGSVQVSASVSADYDSQGAQGF